MSQEYGPNLILRFIEDKSEIFQNDLESLGDVTDVKYRKQYRLVSYFSYSGTQCFLEMSFTEDPESKHEPPTPESIFRVFIHSQG